jgi:hypothetical protein
MHPRIVSCIIIPTHNNGKVFPVSKRHTIKTYAEVEENLHALITLELNGGEWSASRSDHTAPEERTPGTVLTGSRSGSNGEEERYCPCQELKPGS